MGDQRLLKRVMSGELENAGKHRPGGKEKKWTDCVAEDHRLFGITGHWSTAAVDPGILYSTVCKGAVGLWSRGWGERKRRPETGRGREKRKRGEIMRLYGG